jgi:hypothetical protein
LVPPLLLLRRTLRHSFNPKAANWYWAQYRKCAAVIVQIGMRKGGCP